MTASVASHRATDSAATKRPRRIARLVPVLGLAAALATAGLAAPIAARAADAHTIVVGGLERSYLLTVPRSVDPATPAPLIVALHGGGSDANRAKRYGWEPVARREGIIVAYPSAIDGHWNDGRGVYRYRSHRENVDDVGFLDALITRLRRQHRIDATRIYVTGASNGAMMSFRFAAESRTRLAAIGTFIGNLPEWMAGAASANPPVSAVMINGTEDPLMPFDGGLVNALGRPAGRVVSFAETVRFWVRHDGTSPVPTVRDVPDRDRDDGTTSVRARFADGDAGTEVIAYVVDGGGHTLPGGVQYLPERIIGKTSGDFDGIEAVWAFFQAHPRR